MNDRVWLFTSGFEKVIMIIGLCLISRMNEWYVVDLLGYVRLWIDGEHALTWTE